MCFGLFRKRKDYIKNSKKHIKEKFNFLCENGYKYHYFFAMEKKHLVFVMMLSLLKFITLFIRLPLILSCVTVQFLLMIFLR